MSQKPSHMVAVRVPSDLMKALDRAKEKHGVAYSAIIVAALRAYFDVPPPVEIARADRGRKSK
jgi:hypothetical protein